MDPNTLQFPKVAAAALQDYATELCRQSLTFDHGNHRAIDAFLQAVVARELITLSLTLARNQPLNNRLHRAQLLLSASYEFNRRRMVNHFGLQDLPPEMQDRELDKYVKAELDRRESRERVE